MKAKKALALLLALVMMLGVLAACASDEGTTEPATGDTTTTEDGSTTDSGDTTDSTDTSGETTDESGIEYNGRNKLVMFGPLTGDNMQYGIKIRDGAQLAVDQFNAEHGTSFTIEFQDDKGDPNEAVNLANMIVSDDTVVAALAGYGSTCALATAQIFDESEMILIGVAASHADLPSMGEYIFPIPMSQRLEAVEFANATEELAGLGSVAILYQNTDQGVQACQLFRDQWESLGGEVVVYESFVPGETNDFASVLSMIKNENPDILYVNAAYNDVAQIFLQAKQLELDAQYVGPGMCVNEEFLNLVGTDVDGALILSSTPCFLPSVLESGDVDETTQAFIDAYQTAFGETPDGFSAQGYDSVNIVLNSVLNAGTTDTAAVAEQIMAIRDYPGLSGYDMSYNDQKEMNKGIYVFEIENGTFVRVK